MKLAYTILYHSILLIQFCSDGSLHISQSYKTIVFNCGIDF